MPGTPTPNRGYDTMVGSDQGLSVDNTHNAAMAKVDTDVQGLLTLLAGLTAGSSAFEVLRISGTTADLLLKDTDAPANQKVLRLRVAGGVATLQGLNDAESSTTFTFLTLNLATGALTFPNGTITEASLAFAVATQAELDALSLAGAAHFGLTTTAHGGIVASTDPRLSDARPPQAHTHDDRYYTEGEIDARLALPAESHLQDQLYYYKHLGRVYLRGTFTGADFGGGYYFSTALPGGYRPPVTERFGGWASSVGGGMIAGWIQNDGLLVTSYGGPIELAAGTSFRV